MVLPLFMDDKIAESTPLCGTEQRGSLAIIRALLPFASNEFFPAAHQSTGCRNSLNIYLFPYATEIKTRSNGNCYPRESCDQEQRLRFLLQRRPSCAPASKKIRRW
jgi:hypothetical protein